MDDLAEERVKTKIRKILKDMLEKNVISKTEFDAMSADDKTPGRFYSNFKIHKPHKHGEPPPVRPIISGAGSITEGIATFVEFFIQKIATTHETYLQDTPDFLRMISQLNKGPKLGKNAILATWDVIGLYTNIIHTEGLSCLQEQLNEQTHHETPSEHIIQLMEVILKQNIFTFHDSLWKQEVGAAMGSKPIPHYANIFMARTMDKGMKNLALKYNKKNTESLQLLKRFLDDYFSVFNGTTKQLHKLLKEINQLHPTIKLTMNHISIPGEALEDKCDCNNQESIPFLDTLCTIKNGHIETDLYKKDTDRHQYLLPTSCHPKQTTKAIPYSLGVRIVRICSEPIQRDQRLQELERYLLQRGYNEKVVASAIVRAKRIPRDLALKKVGHQNVTKRPVFATTYDPRLPSITSIILS